MNIEEAKPIIDKQIVLKRTSKGRGINENAIEALKTSLEDEGNLGTEFVVCKNCGFVVSSLLIFDGCPNCGGLDF